MKMKTTPMRFAPCNQFNQFNPQIEQVAIDVRKKVFQVRTKGRDEDIIHNTTELSVTAERLKKDFAFAPGEHCVRVVDALSINGVWYAPTNIVAPSINDKKEHKEKTERNAIIEDMLKAGFTYAQIDRIQQG